MNLWYYDINPASDFHCEDDDDDDEGEDGGGGGTYVIKLNK